MKTSPDHRTFKEFSTSLHDAQKSLKILSSLRWSNEFTSKFLEQTARPKKESVHYIYPTALDLKKTDQFRSKLDTLTRENDRVIAKRSSDVASLMTDIISDFRRGNDLQLSVGRSEFGERSNACYGSLRENSGKSTEFANVVNVAKQFSDTLAALRDDEIDALYPKVLSADGLATILRTRLREAHLIKQVDIIVTDKLMADAAAGSAYVKLRKDAKFSLKDADVLLYHEIFTHVVTNLNGRAQTHAGWLGFDSPRITETQEGLAVFTEVVTGKTYPRRLRKIVDRILILKMITDGDHCGHIYDWLRERGYSHKDSMALVMRAHRGMEPGSRAPFTKDITYLQGLLSVFNFIKVNLVKSRFERIETLFCGKLALSDVPVLTRLREAGIVEAPRWIPQQFLDLDSLSTWFSCVMIFGSLTDSNLQSKFEP